MSEKWELVKNLKRLFQKMQASVSGFCFLLKELE